MTARVVLAAIAFAAPIAVAATSVVAAAIVLACERAPTSTRTSATPPTPTTPPTPATPPTMPATPPTAATPPTMPATPPTTPTSTSSPLTLTPPPTPTPTATPPTTTAGPPDATIRRSCAPWDGAAFHIAIGSASCADAKGAEVGLSIFRDLPPAGTSWTFDETNAVGAAARCVGEAPCESAKGTLTIEQFGDAQVRGHVDVVFGDGTRVKRAFTAAWCNDRPVCG